MFEENLVLLEEVDTRLAEKIQAKCVENPSFQLCKTRCGETNLVLLEDGKQRYVHANYSARKEAESWLQSLDIDYKKVLYVYGLGLAYSYDLLQDWLKEDPERYLVYIEDDIRVVAAFLHTERAKNVLQHPQVMLTYVDEQETPGHTEELCQDLAYYFVGLPFEIACIPYYQRAHEKQYRVIQRRLLHSSAYVGFVSKESLDHGAPFFQNFYSNLLHLPDVYGWKNLVGAFEGVPAIICGAGPSLNKNFELLKDLKERALILAGGSAIKALSMRGLIPHLGGSVDPNPLQHERMMEHTAYEMPTFFKGRAYHGVLNTLQGPRVYLPRNNCYPITEWFEDKLKIDEPQPTEGHNVLHLLIDLARMMGCSPIIFVGMDLAFTGLQQYADAVVDNNTLSKEQLTKGSNLNDNAFPRKDIHGETVYTLWKWVAESNYTTQYAKEHPDTQFINATEGGLGFEEIPNLSLHEVVEQHLSLQYDISGKLHRLIQQSPYHHINRNHVLEEMLELYASLHNCVSLCNKLLKNLEDFEQTLKKGNRKQLAQLGEDIESLQQQLSDETACRYILEPVSHMRSIFFERHFDQLSYEERPLSDLERMLERCDTNRKEIEFLEDSALTNIRLLKASITTFGKRGFDVSFFTDRCQKWETMEVGL